MEEGDDPIYDNALQAVQRMFGDQTADAETARDRLTSLRDELDIMIDSLE